MDTFQKRLSPLDIGAPQFRGGVVTVRPRALIPVGSFSVLNNVRGFHPGFKKRDGQSKLHTTSQFATKSVEIPAYNAGVSTYASSYDTVANAVWATARDAATGSGNTISTEHNNNCIALEAGGTYTVGRTFLFFDLSRTGGVVSAANLVIKLRNGTNLASIIVKRFTGNAPDLNDSADITADADFDAIGYTPATDDYSSAFDLSTTGAADTWQTIPLNALALTDINAAIGETDYNSCQFMVVLTEYAHDDQDSAPAAAATHDCNFYIATAANLPRLQLTMSTPEEIIRLYQWSKGKIAERHLFAQTETGDLIEATNDPPTTTTGDFGTVVAQPRASDGSFLPTPILTTGYSNLVPASFGFSRDNMVYSDGISQHRVYTGQNQPIESFKLVDQAAALPENPTDGIDYSTEASDGDPDTFVDLSSLGDLATDYEAFFIKTRFKANKFTFTIRTPNSSSADLKMKSYDKVAGWQDRTITDGTASGGATLNQSGSVTWTADPEEIELYAFGENGYWYMFYLDTGDSLDATCTISEITYEGPWQKLENVWNGVMTNAIEIYHYDASEDIYFMYSGAGADLVSVHYTGDYIYFSSTDNLVGAHFDFGATPNLTTTTTILEVAGWDGNQWVDAVETDFTDGFQTSGFITWKRNADFQPREFQGSKYSAYWWRIDTGVSIMSEAVVVTIRTLPWFDINDLGAFGLTNTMWKERGIYTFDKYASWIYVSENAELNKLNGADFAVLQAGDGRQNAIVASAKFHNELLVWQEEKGREGGCLTMFEGYSPSTFGKLLLSAKIGSFSQKSVVVIDGANSYTRKDDNQQTLAFFISRYGIYVTDGSVVTRISNDIQNYFDPRFAECINKDYGKEMYVEHDTTANVLRFGLVSGSSATQCNVFPVFDMVDWTWSFDTLGQNHTCVHEVEASTGQFPVLQIASSVNGFVYLLNDTSVVTDDGTSIALEARPEFSSRSKHLEIGEVIIRTAAVSDSDSEEGDNTNAAAVAFQMYEDGKELTEAAWTISMVVPDTELALGQDLIRERIIVDSDQASNISIRLTHSRNEPCYLYDFNLDLKEAVGR
jgi:hypothetical protein